MSAIPRMSARLLMFRMSADVGDTQDVSDVRDVCDAEDVCDSEDV